MPTITSLETDRRQRVRVFLDGSFALSLEAEVVAEAGLSSGKELSPVEVDALLQKNESHRCYAAALRLLACRPRSQAEIKRHLSRRFPPDAVATTLEKLSSRGLIDDIAFARFWREVRERGSPRGGYLLRRELREKGIPEEVAKEAAQDLDETENAYRAARTKLSRWAGLDYPRFRQKCAGFLRRRGFPWEVVRGVLERLWQER